MNGIGFIPDRTLIGKDGKVIVFPDGSSIPSEFTPQACTNKIRGQNSTSTDGEKRKQKSISYLQDKGIPYIEGLPQLPPLTSIQLRSREEITKRAVALLIVIQYACDVAQEGDLKTSKEFVMESLNQFDVVESLTMQERNFLNSEEPDEKEAIQIAWQYEAQWVLLWSIGLVNTLKFPREICDCHYAIKLVSDCSSFNEFYQKQNCEMQKKFWTRPTLFIGFIGLVYMIELMREKQLQVCMKVLLLKDEEACFG